MSKKNKNVFEKVEESLQMILEELQTANSIAYWIATEAVETSEKLDSLSAKVDILLTSPLKVTVDYEQLADAIIKALGYTMTQEVPKMEYPKTKRGET